MRNPAFLYALTLDQIGPDSPLAVSSPRGMVVNYGVWRITPGRLVASGAFIGTPRQDSFGRWICGNTSGSLVVLSNVGVVPYANGEWAGKFCVADATVPALIKAIQDGELPSQYGPNAMSIIELD